MRDLGGFLLAFGITVLFFAVAFLPREPPRSSLTQLDRCGAQVISPPKRASGRRNPAEPRDAPRRAAGRAWPGREAAAAPALRTGPAELPPPGTGYRLPPWLAFGGPFSPKEMSA